jgi:hypothetical protein
MVVGPFRVGKRMRMNMAGVGQHPTRAQAGLSEGQHGGKGARQQRRQQAGLADAQEPARASHNQRARPLA